MNKGKVWRIGVVGATGYVGAELLRILAGHRFFEVTHLVSKSYAGKRLSDVYPAFRSVNDLVLHELDADMLAEHCDLVVTALPHGVSSVHVPELLDRGLKVLDHSGDFRYRDLAVYEKAYKLQHPRPDLLAEAVYGLPEIYREQLRETRLTANPGCYPTCSILALMPLLRAGLILTDGIIIDAVSGVTGAGRKADLAFSFCEVDDSFKAYGVIGHRHTSEIEQECALLAGLETPPAITFTPHLAPIRRGMLATIYADLLPGSTLAEVRSLYEQAYADEPFVRLLTDGQTPETRHVAYTNFIELALFHDARTGKLKILSAIDNLGKGAAAQAVQALNLMAGISETEGLGVAGCMI